MQSKIGGLCSLGNDNHIRYMLIDDALCIVGSCVVGMVVPYDSYYPIILLYYRDICCLVRVDVA